MLFQHHQSRMKFATMLSTWVLQSTFLSSYALAWPSRRDDKPHCETERLVAADYTIEHCLTTALHYQYIGTVGSTLSEYACIPPSRLLSCAKPSDCKYSAACWDLMPWWHITIVCLNGFSSLVTVRPQSRILQGILCCVEVAA